MWRVIPLRFIVRKTVATLAAVVLSLSACSSDGDTDGESTPAETTQGETTDTETSEPSGDTVTPVISSEGMPVPVDNDGVVTLDFEGATEPDQLQVSVVEEGDGDEVSATDMVIVNYAGQVWGSDSTFDSSYERGAPAAFPLNSVVQGWRDGLSGQKVGSRVVISVPSELGYGPSGGNAQAGIGPEDTIVFVVDIIDAVDSADMGDPNATVVTPVEELPVTIEGNLGEPVTVTVNDGVEEPTEVSSTVIAESDGEPVGGEGTTVYIQYSLNTWDNQTPQSSNDFGGLQSFVIGSGSIFDELEGMPVGSRVLFLVPASGDSPSMVAVVDIVGQLDAAPEQEGEE